MNIIEAVAKTVNEAKVTNRHCYLYLRNNNYLVSSDYEKDWLFQAYPGSRKILSVKGNQLVVQAITERVKL